MSVYEEVLLFLRNNSFEEKYYSASMIARLIGHKKQDVGKALFKMWDKGLIEDWPIDKKSCGFRYKVTILGHNTYK